MNPNTRDPNEPESLRDALLAIIATLPKNEQGAYREGSDEMSHGAIADGYGLMHSQLAFIADL